MSLNIGELSVPGIGSVKNINGSLSLKSAPPSAYGTVDRTNGPIKSMDAKGNLRIKNREYIGDILSTDSAFLIHHTYNLNPTVASTFPWLASVAGSFQKFCFESLCFEYQTQSGTSTTGNIMMIPQYDVSDIPPASKSDALTFVDSVRGPAWQESCCVLPRSRLCGLSSYFTEIDVDDVKMSIPGKVHIATSNCSDSGPLTGEIWVSYDVKLMAPQHSMTDPLTGFFDMEGTTPTPLTWLNSAGYCQLSTSGNYWSSEGTTITAETLVARFKTPGSYFVQFMFDGDSRHEPVPHWYLENSKTSVNPTYFSTSYNPLGIYTRAWTVTVGLEPLILNIYNLNTSPDPDVPADWSLVKYTIVVAPMPFYLAL